MAPKVSSVLTPLLGFGSIDPWRCDTAESIAPLLSALIVLPAIPPARRQGDALVA
jgi:hypothetical protein